MSKNQNELVKQKIDLYANDSQVMNDAIDRIVVEIYNKRKDYENAQKLLLTACAPQCGTTSICISLGMALASAKWNTLIIDCDLRRMQDLKKLNANVEEGLSDFLQKEVEIEDKELEKVIYETNIPNLSYIPCGKYNSNPARLFCSEVMEKVLDYANKNYDCVIFDFPSISVAPDAQILFGKVDGIILVSALDYVTKKQIKQAKNKVQPFAERYYGMIINKIDLGLYRKYIKRFDYYFRDKYGKQRLGGNVERKYTRIQKEIKSNLKEEEKDEKKE